MKLSWKSCLKKLIRPPFTCKIFWPHARSRNAKELHDGLENAVKSANLCHLANISYRVGRKLTIADGNFVNDGEAQKLQTRNYRAPYVV